VYRLKGLTTRVPWFSTNPKRRHHPPFPDPAVVVGLRRVIASFKPDLIHAYGWITYSCAAALLGKKIPLLLSVREYGYTCALRTMMRFGTQLCDGPQAVKCMDCAVRFYGLPKGLSAALGVYLGRALLRWKTRGLHSVSTYMQQIIRQDLYHANGKVRGPGGILLPDVVIPSFRDLAEEKEIGPAEVEQHLERLPGEPFILFVGALRLVKGIQPLLEAYGRLVSPPPLVLIGVAAPDTPGEFPGNITVLYDLPHAAVLKAWERSSFGVAPSIWPEPFGSVIHEAMSKGKAVIGTYPGGQADMIVHNETGLLVPANDVGALAQAMQRLIDDPGLRERMGKAGRERAKLFTGEMVVPRFEQVYRRLVHGETSNPHEINTLSLGRP
jgi:glycosyltransferase involved in cell wall biosynthesis